MERVARNIELVHRDGIAVATRTTVEPGVIVERRPDALGRVGIYAPGGRAAYASSVLMAAVPARVAGVREVILCSPPGPTGLPAREVLAAAALSGVDRVFAVGGAGAIAAMALGTETVPRCDKVVGPGNAWVAEAKLQLVSRIAIDSPAGPSELLVIADDSADSAAVAREMLAQAEHDPKAVVILLAIGDSIASDVERELEQLLTSQPRSSIIEEALAAHGGIVVVSDVIEAVSIANEIAPEHLMIATRNAGRVADDVRSAGAIFLGETSSVVFGDYITGGNHVLPTGGLARAYSGLSTLDFIRWTSIQSVSASGAASLATDAGAFASAEGLPSHASAALAWSRQ